ncbi:DNA polymerase IV [Youngiibacter fragilis 232.1]|uniref:DNA polymerase IV n=1 Tax=Youngiibacter fragilis 232.1 TaxID=994573 RepID=V7I7P8_9CLOT|nr:DNA polymerase IV [Youngiibacter fragilis 232.1]
MAKVDRVIFLVDMNAFFVTCEMTRNKDLIGKPSAVAGDPKKRTGIILAANYDARACGVRTAMPLNQALKLCPELVVVPPDHRFYSEMSDRVMELLSHYSPVVEQNSIDEAWLDMTGMEEHFGDPVRAAGLIMDDIRETLGLWCSIGIADNKFLAKMASELKKPLGITRLPGNDYKTRLWPLPVREMYGIGKKTEEQLSEIGIRTIGELALADEALLTKKFGKAGRVMHDHANGIDCDPVTPRHHEDMKSIGKSVTMSEDITDIDTARRVLMRLSDEISTTARKNCKCGHTVQITIKYSNFTTITRQMTIPPTDISKRIFASGCELLEKNWDSRKPVRLLGISLSGFEVQSEIQLDLFSDLTDESYQADGKEEKIQKAIDDIRNKFGKDKVSWGTLLKKSK